MTSIASTSGRLHSEFVRLLFLQTHRETDRGLLHLHRVVFTQQLKTRVDLTLTKEEDLRISIFRCSSSPNNPEYVSHVDSSPLGFSHTDTHV
jgi:hypothetical protein